MTTFRQKYTVDVNGLPVVNLRGRIYDIDDTEGGTPLPVTDVGGVPMALVEVTELGVSQAFVVEDRTQVRWISEDGQVHVIFESLEGMEAKAASAVATAESALQQMSQFMSRVGVPGGVAALNPEGNVVDADANVVGNDTRRPGSVVFAVGSTTVRPTGSRDVMVLWITEGPEPINAVPGIDVWINGVVVS